MNTVLPTFSSAGGAGFMKFFRTSTRKFSYSWLLQIVPEDEGEMINFLLSINKEE